MLDKDEFRGKWRQYEIPRGDGPRRGTRYVHPETNIVISDMAYHNIPVYYRLINEAYEFETHYFSTVEEAKDSVFDLVQSKIGYLFSADSVGVDGVNPFLRKSSHFQPMNP